MTIFSFANVDSCASYRNAYGLSNWGFGAIENFGSSNKTFVFGTYFEGPYFIRITVIVTCRPCNSICKDPVNVCVCRARRCQCRRSTIVRVFIFVGFLSSCGFAVDEDCSGVFYISFGSSSETTRGISCGWVGCNAGHEKCMRECFAIGDVV